MVRHAKHLRPLSLSTTFTSVNDGLWLSKTKHRYDSHSGCGQQGGKSDPISLLLALFVQAQIRAYQGLTTIWNFSDEQWAYDTATFDCMLVASFEAGIVEGAWQLLEDFLTMDTQCIELDNTVSDKFKLIAGVAQGRKWVSQVFSSVHVWLRDIVARTALTTHTWLPAFAAQALHDSLLQSPPASEVAYPRQQNTNRYIAARILVAARTDSKPWQRSLCTATLELCDLPHVSDRAEVLELLGSRPLVPLQYIDDFTSASPSVGACAAVNNIALPEFERRTKSKFNKGCNKTAVMPALCDPEISEELVNCPVVARYRLLGILFDKMLTMEAHLRESCATARNQFIELTTAMESMAFCLPSQAAQIECQLAPKVLYGASFLVGVEGAFTRLNRLQADWARFLLCHKFTAPINGFRAMAQCGWIRRLGTTMIERAIMARVRVALLPEDHPAVFMLHLADHIPAITWNSSLRSTLLDLGLKDSIPDISQLPDLLDNDAIIAARLCSAARKRLLREYRDVFVRPPLDSFEHNAFLVAVEQKHVLDTPYIHHFAAWTY